VRLLPEPLDGLAKLVGQLPQVLTDDILQLHSFQVVPDSLIGVQLRRVGWQPLQVDSLPSGAGQKGFNFLATVDGSAIPNNQQAHRDVGGQAPEETGGIPTTEGPVLRPGVQPAMRSDAAGHREMVPAEGRPEHWGLASGGIGLDHQGQQVAAGLVYEDDGSAFLPGLFSRRASAPLSSAGWLPRPAGWRVSGAAGGSSCTG
jgi:hypothetical protein